MSLFKSGIVTRLLILYFFFSCESIQEQQCSKFPYEEALLERMIRTEFNVQKMTEEIKEEREKMRQNISNMHKTMATGWENMWAAFNADIQGPFKEIQHDYEHQKSKVRALVGAVKDTREVFFRASEVFDTSPQDKKAIVFTNKHEDLTNSYDNSSGVFTAPVQGQYLFAVQFCSTIVEKENKRNLYFAFVVDGTIQKPVSGYFVYYTCFTTTFLARLETGQRVWIESIWNHGTAVLTTNKFLSNYFSGLRIN